MTYSCFCIPKTHSSGCQEDWKRTLKTVSNDYMTLCLGFNSYYRMICPRRFFPPRRYWSRWQLCWLHQQIQHKHVIWFGTPGSSLDRPEILKIQKDCHRLAIENISTFKWNKSKAWWMLIVNISERKFRGNFFTQTIAGLGSSLPEDEWQTCFLRRSKVSIEVRKT